MTTVPPVKRERPGEDPDLRDDLENWEEDLKRRERSSGSRGRALEIARNGPEHLAGEVNRQNRDLIQYRSFVSLLWDRERILKETNWTLQRIMAAERAVREEDRKRWERSDPAELFADYREQQLLCARELSDMAENFKASRQFSAFNGAIKARSEILDKIFRMGQEMGVIKRAARELRVHGKIDIRKLSLTELRVHLADEIEGLRTDLERSLPKLEGAPAAVLRRLRSRGNSKAIEASCASSSDAEESPPKIRRLARSAGE